MWASAGTFTYVNAVVFKLQDATSDSGVHWDSKDSIVPLLYPDSYSGDLAWLNFKGAWGNKGTTKCWWHAIFSDCEIVDGPGGPVRDDVFNAASIRSLGRVRTASNVKRVSPTFQMTGPLSVRAHLLPFPPDPDPESRANPVSLFSKRWLQSQTPLNRPTSSASPPHRSTRNSQPSNSTVAHSMKPHRKWPTLPPRFRPPR